MHIRRIALALLLLGATACDESPVSLPEAAGVTVAAGTMALAVGDAAPVAAQVVDQDGQVMQGLAVVYSTDNASVATVGTDGMVRGVGPGTANITATHGGSTATVKVTVTAQAMQVKVPNATMGLVVGEAAPAGAQVLGAHGQVVQGAVPVFSSDNPGVATVGTDGVVRGVTPGTATIRASYGASSATVQVTVAADRRSELQTLDVMADSVVTDWRAGVQVVAVRAVNGFGQTVCPAITLRTSDRAVATARTAGPCRIEVVPNFTGEAVITVDADGRTGATVSYTVKVLDQASRPIVNQRVSFEASVGSVSANSVITGEDGTATVQWQIPTDLRGLGQNHWFAFRALLPNGVLVARDETVFIDGASLAEIVLYRTSGSGWTRLDAAAFTAPAFTFVNLGASGLDQYGNVRTVDFTFALTGNWWAWSCNTSNGTRDASGIEYTCFYSGPGNTVTMRATAQDGQNKSVQVTFN
jgi:hypothetical protein